MSSRHSDTFIRFSTLARDEGALGWIAEWLVHRSSPGKPTRSRARPGWARPDPAQPKAPPKQGFLSAPERIRTSTTYSGHKALNLAT
jgi:hypothetical protein